MVFLLAARIIDTQHGDEAVRLEDIGAQCPGRDLLQQAVACPQVAAGVRALPLRRREAGGGQGRGLIRTVCPCLMPQGLRGPHALGHPPAQRVIGVLAQLLAGGGAVQPCAGEHVGELALCVVSEVLLFVAAGFLG